MKDFIFFIYLFFFLMRLLSDKHHLQCMRKSYLQYFEITLLTYKTEKLLIMTYTLRYLENLKNLQYTVITYKRKKKN